jgi:hypothetical protein
MNVNFSKILKNVETQFYAHFTKSICVDRMFPSVLMNSKETIRKHFKFGIEQNIRNNELLKC